MAETLRIVLIAGSVATWFLWGMTQDFAPCHDKPACWKRIENAPDVKGGADV